MPSISMLYNLQLFMQAYYMYVFYISILVSNVYVDNEFEIMHEITASQTLIYHLRVCLEL